MSARNKTVERSTNYSSEDDEYPSDKSSGRGDYNLSGVGSIIYDKLSSSWINVWWGYFNSAPSQIHD